MLPSFYLEFHSDSFETNTNQNALQVNTERMTEHIFKRQKDQSNEMFTLNNSVRVTNHVPFSIYRQKIHSIYLCSTNEKITLQNCLKELLNILYTFTRFMPFGCWFHFLWLFFFFFVIFQIQQICVCVCLYNLEFNVTWFDRTAGITLDTMSHTYRHIH